MKLFCLVAVMSLGFSFFGAQGNANEVIEIQNGATYSQATLTCMKASEAHHSSSEVCKDAPSENPLGPLECYFATSGRTLVDVALQLCQGAVNSNRAKCFNKRMGFDDPNAVSFASDAAHRIFQHEVLAGCRELYR